MRLYDFFYKNPYWLLRHLAFWSFFYLDELLSIMGVTEQIGLDFIVTSLIPDLILVYFNLYVLIPRFFEKGKIGTYLVATILSLLLAVGITEWILYEPCEDCPIFYSIFYTTMYTTGLLGIAIAIKISKITYLKQIKVNKLQELQHYGELDYLKKQVNPHFMFNVLNNMYVQSKENPAEVPETILKLSDLMRYQTYDAAKDLVPLNREIDFIQKYLDLEKMRREYLTVYTEVKGDTNLLEIPPLLFLPFVENACKHSAGSDNQIETIRIQWEFKDESLTFSIQNTIGSRTGHIDDKEFSGFGLENVKKRLELIYAENYSLDIFEQNNNHYVTFRLHKI